jgi:aryl-alcohol dehydrogenase-like predicted oxidoreductase
VYNPLAGGLLAGKHSRGGEPAPGSRFAGNEVYQRRYLSERMFDQVEALKKVAEGEGLSLLELSYAWVAGRPGVDSILVGPGTVGHLDDAVRSSEKRLSPEALARIDELHREYLGTEAHYVR